MTNSETTNVFLILNEETMEIVTQTIGLNNGFAMHKMPMLFSTEEEANDFAASNLEIWDVVKSNFNHKWIQHKQNTKAEVVKVELGRHIDTQSNHLIVKIRFAHWFLTFDWKINCKTNFVHTDESPTHLDGADLSEATETERNNAKAIMHHFNFEAWQIGEEIEARTHNIL